MRLINADALEKTLRDWIRDHWTEAFTGDDAGSEFADMIERAETIDIGKGDKIMEWIPCTERLPEKSGQYLVTRKFNALSSLWDKVGKRKSAMRDLIAGQAVTTLLAITGIVLAAIKIWEDK